MGQAVPYIAMGLSTLAGGIQGLGAMRGQQYEAQKLQRAAQIGKVQADQADAQMREDFASTVSNIRAIRASSGINADSPSTRAYIAEEERIAGRERRIRVGGIRMQARQYESDAKFLRRSAKWSLFGGIVGGLASGF